MAPSKRPSGAAKVELQKKRRLQKEFVAFTGRSGYCYTFGESLFGALGHGEDVTERRTALQVDVADQQVLAICSGDMHSVAVTEDGSVYTWGVNDEGALGRPTDGDAWNSTANGERGDSCVPGRACMPEGAFTVQVVAGGGFTFALTDTGAVYGWGLFKDEVMDSDAKQFCGGVKLQRLPTLIYQPEDLRDRVIKLAAGTSHVAALNRRGDVLTWGFGFMGQLGRVHPYLKEGPGVDVIKSMLTPTPVPGVAAAIGTDVVDIACGAYSTFAINKRGAVAAWGLNNHGQLALPIDEAALAKEQQQLQFLQGQSGEAPAQNGGNSSAQQQQEDDGGKPGDLHLPQEMPEAGEPWNHCYWSPAAVESLPGPIKAVAGGNNHSLFLTKKHAVLTCGERNYGMLGRKDLPPPPPEDLWEPAEIDRVDKLEEQQPVAVAAGPNVSCCITADGGCFVWGTNTNTQMAKGGDDSDNLQPKRIGRTARFRPELEVVQLAFGSQHGILLAVKGEAALAEEAARAAAAAPPAEAAPAAAPAEEAAPAAQAAAEPAAAGGRKRKAPAAAAAAAGGKGAGSKRSKRG